MLTFLTIGVVVIIGGGLLLYRRAEGCWPWEY